MRVNRLYIRESSAMRAQGARKRTFHFIELNDELERKIVAALSLHFDELRHLVLLGAHNVELGVAKNAEQRKHEALFRYFSRCTFSSLVT